MPTYPLIITAPDHYDRRRTKRTLALEVVSPATLVSGDYPQLKIINRHGNAMDCRISGNPKTWKRKPRVEVPATVGFREHFHLISSDGFTWDEDIPYRVLSASDEPNYRTQLPRPLSSWYCDHCRQYKTSMHESPDSGLCADCHATLTTPEEA